MDRQRKTMVYKHECVTSDVGVTTHYIIVGKRNRPVLCNCGRASVNIGAVVRINRPIGERISVRVDVD